MQNLGWFEVVVAVIVVVVAVIVVVVAGSSARGTRFVAVAVVAPAVAAAVFGRSDYLDSDWDRRKASATRRFDHLQAQRQHTVGYLVLGTHSVGAAAVAV